MIYNSVYTTRVGKLSIGQGRPKIVASIIAYDEEEFRKKVILAEKSPCDLIELRADSMAMRRYKNPENIKNLVNMVKTVTEKPIILTIRSMDEGGMANIDRKSYYILLRDIIECFDMEEIKPELIDIEVFDKDYGARVDMMEFMISLAHDAGMKVIVSNHDVYKTPSVYDMVKRIRILDKFGADILKGAYMTESDEDVENVVAANNILGEEIEKPYVMIAMGTKGQRTRTGHKIGIGSCRGDAITFACLGDEAAAKGQMTVEEMDSALSDKWKGDLGL